MRIVVLMTWKGMTIQQYEKIRKLVDWDNKKPKGAVLHVVCSDSKNLRITDVWESEKELNAFVQERLAPKVEEIGFKSKPEIEVYPLHNLYAPGV
jgi:hypothetical protein